MAQKGNKVAEQVPVGEQLRIFRLEAGETLKGASGKAGINIGFISKIELGLKPPSAKAIENLCNAYGLDAYDLCFRFGKIPPTMERRILSDRKLFDKIRKETEN